MSAARWMKVPPWELNEQPVAYIRWALMSMAAENQAKQGKKPL